MAILSSKGISRSIRRLGSQSWTAPAGVPGRIREERPVSAVKLGVAGAQVPFPAKGVAGPARTHRIHQESPRACLIIRHFPVRRAKACVSGGLAMSTVSSFTDLVQQLSFVMTAPTFSNFRRARHGRPRRWCALPGGVTLQPRYARLVVIPKIVDTIAWRLRPISSNW
jgi:hypothetical protein